MIGKDLYLCGIFLTSALCFSQRGKDKKGTEERHGREKAELCIYVLSEIKITEKKRNLKNKEPLLSCPSCLLSLHFHANPSE